MIVFGGDYYGNGGPNTVGSSISQIVDLPLNISTNPTKKCDNASEWNGIEFWIMLPILIALFIYGIVMTFCCYRIRARSYGTGFIHLQSNRSM